MLTLFRSLFAPPRHLILVLVAVWLGQALAGRRVRGQPVLQSAVDSLAGAMLIAFVLGGRLIYAVSHFGAFTQSPPSLVSLNTDLFDAWGGAACALIAAVVTAQGRHMPLLQALDLLTPMFAMVAIGLSLSHLASGAAFGSPTNVPWAIALWGAERHPTQLYEFAAGIMALAVIWFPRRSPLPGLDFLLWAAVSAAGRLITEGFRGDSVLVPGNLRLAQIIAWVLLAAALAGLDTLQTRGQQEAEGVKQERATPD